MVCLGCESFDRLDHRFQLVPGKGHPLPFRAVSSFSPFEKRPHAVSPSQSSIRGPQEAEPLVGERASRPGFTISLVISMYFGMCHIDSVTRSSNSAQGCRLLSCIMVIYSQVKGIKKSQEELSQSSTKYCPGLHYS